MLWMVRMYSPVKQPRKPIYVFFVKRLRKGKTLAAHLLREKN